MAKSNEYRIIEGYGNHMEKRFEVQEKYTYYDNGEWIDSWHMVFHSTNVNDCIAVRDEYMKNPPKKWGISLEEALEVW